MDRAGDQVLAGPALAVDQDRRGLALRNLGDQVPDLPHPGRLAHDLRLQERLQLPAAERVELVLARDPGLQPLDREDHLVHLVGLLDEVGRSTAHRLDRGGQVPECRDHDHLEIRLDALQPRQQLEPAAVREPEVQDQDLGRVVPDRFQHLGRRAHRVHFIAFRLQELHEGFPDELLVVRDRQRFSLLVDEANARGLAGRGSHDRDLEAAEDRLERIVR